MPEKSIKRSWLMVNRVPVLTLWAAVVGKVWEVKEQRRKMRKEETVTIELLYHAVPAKHTDEGLLALSGENPMPPESVQKYLKNKFGDSLEDVSNAMLELTKSLPPSPLADKAYGLYEKFKPEIPSCKKGWGRPAGWTWISSARRPWPVPRGGLFKICLTYT
jgi:hypothetical protein